MEGKKNTGLVTILAILMLIFAAGSVLLFTGVIKSPMVKCEETKEEKSDTKTTDDTKKEENKEENKETSVVNEKSDEERYAEFLNNIKTRKNAEPVSRDNKIFILGNDNKMYIVTNDQNDQEIPGARGSGGYWHGQYINIDNVVRIFNTSHSIIVGEGGSDNGILLLKEDGSLYIMKNAYRDDYTIEKLDEYKNIVTAYSTIDSYGTTFVVDINGKQFDIK